MRLWVVLTITGIVLLGCEQAFGQSYSEEALMISRIRPGGSARIQAMGGVQNSLGGDISSAYYNPAGLGMYNRSDFSFTPGYVTNSSTSSYLGNSATENKSNLYIPNIGIAFASKKEGGTGPITGTLGISYNRINDFNHTFSYSGKSTTSSIIEYFIEQANGQDQSQFSSNGSNYNTVTELGYQNFLIGPRSIIDPSYPNTEYFSDVYGAPVQSEVVKTSGAQSQLNISYGANFSDKFFIGGSLGLASLTYKAVKTYTETFSDPPMSEMVLTETLNLSGSGINLTLGTIYRPIDQVQIGLSVATPTAYSITDNYSANMTTNWQNFEYTTGEFLNKEQASTDLINSNYNLNTPWRFSGGATFFIGKRGFISADAEFMKYSSTKFSSDNGDDYSADNNTIRGLYKSVVNLRIGGEYRYNNFRFRGGYSLMPDPFQTEQNGVDRALTSYSAGVGYRVAKFYADFAAIFAQGNNSYRPYTLYNAPSPLVTLANKSTTFMITIGFPF
jgi:hypothetical protein